MAIVIPSAAQIATGSSAAIPVRGRNVNLIAHVTAVTGTGGPSMTLSVEWSSDGSTFAVADSADAFAAITAAKDTAKQFAIKAPFYRVTWTITGTTPSFTFSIDEYTN